MGDARLLSFTDLIQAGLCLFALPEVPWTSVRCAAPCMVLHGRGLPALRGAPSLAWMGLLLSLQLAYSQVKPVECPGAGVSLKNRGKLSPWLSPAQQGPIGCLTPCLECWISRCGLREQSVSTVLPEVEGIWVRSTPFPSTSREYTPPSTGDPQSQNPPRLGC